MELLNLGRVPWLDTQLVYHALPRLGREALVLCRPETPYVSVGYHQDLGCEVDLGYCTRSGIPVFRREVGGGTVLLDDRQIFYQLILRKTNPLVTLNRNRFFERFLEPVTRTLAALGTPARFRPHCDIHVQGRKISGNGGGEIDDFAVLVGNVLLGFDFEAMAKVLRVPDPGVRALVRERMEDRMTTLDREVGRGTPPAAVEGLLVENFRRLLPGLSPGRPDAELVATCRELAPRYTSPEWLLEPGRRLPYRMVKISEGAHVYSIPLDGDRTPRRLLLAVEEGRVREIRCSERSAAGGDGGEPWAPFLGKRFLPEGLRRWFRERDAAPGGARGVVGFLSQVTG